MYEEELAESDSSDEDFVPTGAGSEVSEEESDNAVEEDEGDTAKTKNVNKKRKKTESKRTRRKKKKSFEEEEEDQPDEPEDQPKKDENPEEKKKHADALWADFLGGSGPSKKISSSTSPSLNKSQVSSKPKVLETNKDNLKLNESRSISRLQPEASSKSGKSLDELFERCDKKEENDKVVEVFEFAGEKVLVEKTVDPRKTAKGGVAAILSQMNRKGKLSTLEKSKLDWDTFKQKEGITEQLTTHNKGKKGFLEKQDFLERADLRQFEIEKKMRAYNRSKQ